MISAGSAVSDSSTAPRTDCSASRFWGGATGPSGMRGGGAWPLLVRSGVLTGEPSLGSGSDRTHVLPATCGNRSARGARTRTAASRGGRPAQSSSRAAVRLLLLDHHGLDGGDDAVLDLDLDHAGADRLDRLLEPDVALVDRDAARLLDGVDDVLRRHRAEQ